jgi:hypothetical protein
MLQIRSGRCGEETNFLPLPGIELQSPSPCEYAQLYLLNKSTTNIEIMLVNKTQALKREPTLNEHDRVLSCNGISAENTHKIVDTRRLKKSQISGTGHHLFEVRYHMSI